MSTKRTLSYVAIATFTFLLGSTLTLIWLSQRQVKPSQPPLIVPLKESSILEKPNSLKEIKFPRVWHETVTTAGKVEIVESDFLTWKVTLNGEEIFSDDESLPPDVLKQIRSRVAPFDEVLVLWQESGTCCEFGKFWFLGVKADKSYFLSKAIGNGFAHVPDVIVGNDYVKVKIRSGYMHNEPKETSYLPGGTWILRNGRVRKER